MAQIGYSRAVVDANWAFVSSANGFDYQLMTISSNIAEQTEQCLKNIASMLQTYFGAVHPAAMMISARLLDARMLIEIDVTASRQLQLGPRP